MNDEQMREQFEKWAEGIDMAPDFAAERERCPDDPTYGWNYGKLTAWEAWQARDAEVQALQRVLKDARFLIGKLAGWQGVDLSELDDEYDGVITRISAALAGEKGEEK